MCVSLHNGRCLQGCCTRIDFVRIFHNTAWVSCCITIVCAMRYCRVCCCPMLFKGRCYTVIARTTPCCTHLYDIVEYVVVPYCSTVGAIPSLQVQHLGVHICMMLLYPSVQKLVSCKFCKDFAVSHCTTPL